MSILCNGSEVAANLSIMFDIWIVYSMSCSDASTMRAENQSSSIVERRRFFMIRTLLMERSALALVRNRQWNQNFVNAN